jgi:tRNA nucleotidyltransferase/poly(A) polymerase
MSTDSKKSSFHPTLAWDTKPWQAGRWVCEQLQLAGCECFFVGGCVRDLLLGHSVADIDCTTNATPDQVADIFPKIVSVGAAFGIQIVQTPMGDDIEVATYRGETDYDDRRHPRSVRFLTSLIDDLSRRDFTINALAWDPLSAELVDPHQGQRDLANRCLRVVGSDQRLLEDRLRLLRGLRFAARFNLTPTEATAAALRQGDCTGVSRERIWEEWQKSLHQDQQGSWWELVLHYEMASQFLPPSWQATTVSLSSLYSQHVPGQWRGLLGQACILTQHFTDRVQSVSQDAATILLELETWLADQPIAKKLHKRLYSLVVWQLASGWQQEPASLRQKSLRADPELEVLLPMWWQLWPANDGLWPSTDALHDLARTQPLLTAADLLRHGIEPGPRLGALLQAAFELQIEQGLASKELVLRELAHKYPNDHLTGTSDD